MSTPVGRHRARRQSQLRRPAVAATATLSVLAVSAAGYASATDLNPSGATGAMGGNDGLAPVTNAQAFQRTTDTEASRGSTRTLQSKAAKARSDAAVRDKAARAQRAATAKTQQSSAAKAAAARLKKVVADRTSTASDMVDVKVEAPAAKTSLSTPTPEAASRGAERPRVVTSGSPKAIARSMIGSYGWGESQFSCLDKLWTKESGWRVTADNPSSSAYGIPQALPGRKMASAGSDWATNPATQIRWGLGYIQDRYGSPCKAWAHSVAVNWY